MINPKTNNLWTISYETDSNSCAPIQSVHLSSCSINTNNETWLGNSGETRGVTELTSARQYAGVSDLFSCHLKNFYKGDWVSMNYRMLTTLFNDTFVIIVI